MARRRSRDPVVFTDLRWVLVSPDGRLDRAFGSNHPYLYDVRPTPTVSQREEGWKAAQVRVHAEEVSQKPTRRKKIAPR